MFVLHIRLIVRCPAFYPLSPCRDVLLQEDAGVISPHLTCRHAQIRSAFLWNMRECKQCKTFILFFCFRFKWQHVGLTLWWSSEAKMKRKEKKSRWPILISASKCFCINSLSISCSYDDILTAKVWSTRTRTRFPKLYLYPRFGMFFISAVTQHLNWDKFVCTNVNNLFGKCKM